MKKILSGFALLISSAWIGGMWAIGYIAAPVLFYTLQDKAEAGMLAGKMFTVMAYTGMTCGLYLSSYLYVINGKLAFKQATFRIIIVIFLITMLGQFGMQPILAELKANALPLYVMDSPYAERFSFWHGVASISFLIQSLLGAILLLKTDRVRV